jgi:tetratricopeptide (TPR) repeat protein
MVRVEWTVETHCRMARTMSYSRFKKEASAEYQRAIELAQSVGSEEKLKAIYLEYAVSLTNMNTLGCDPNVLQPVEAYIALDQSNYKIYACLGVARLKLEDRKGAIEAFAKALSLNTRDNLVVKALMSALWEEGNHAGMMALLESHDLATTGFWIRGQLDLAWLQEAMFHAAREVGKLAVLIAIYEHEIANTWAQSSGAVKGKDEEDDAKLELDLLWDPIGNATGWANKHKFFSAGTALLRCWLALLHRRYLGQPDTALWLWKTVLFQRSELFKLTKVHSGFSMSIIPDIFAQFAELLYSKALSPPDSWSSANEKMLTMLERLRQRHDAFRELNPHMATISNTKSINVLLARLYMRCGRPTEALVLLSEQFARGVEILKDEIDWNDSAGFHVLAKILFTVGQTADAEIALSLRRFLRFSPMAAVAEEEQSKEPAAPKAKDPDAVETPPAHSTEDADPDDDDDDPPPADIEETDVICASASDCLTTGGLVALGAPMHSCMTCVKVDFCEPCYAAHLSPNSSTKSIYICDPAHEFLCSPLRGWAIAEGIMRFGEGGEEGTRQVKVVDWLDNVEKGWKSKMGAGV